MTWSGQNPVTLGNPTRGSEYNNLLNNVNMLQDLATGLTSGGSANAQTLASAQTAYFNGMPVLFKAGLSNTGAMTLNVNSLGAKNVYSLNGTALIGGEIVAGGWYFAVYDGTEFIVMDNALTFPSWQGTVTTGSANAQALAVPVTNYYAGLFLVFTAGYSTTAATTLNVNSLGAKTIKNQLGNDLTSGDINANGVYAVVYTGTNFMLLNSSAAASVASAVLGSTANNKLRSMTIKFSNTAASTGAGCTLNWTASGGVVQPTPTVNNGGTSGSYAVGDILSISSGTNRATCRVATLSGSQVATVTLVQGGTGYGASGTGTATANNIYQTITTVQSAASGMGFNVSGISTTGVNYLCATANGAGGVVTTGSGATLLSFQFADGTTAKQLQITTSETITEILGVFMASDAQPPAQLMEGYSGSLSSGSMVLNIFNTVGNAAVAWSATPALGANVQFNVFYVVGGAA